MLTEGTDNTKREGVRMGFVVGIYGMYDFDRGGMYAFCCYAGAPPEGKKSSLKLVWPNAGTLL